jgi:hypothetical protein
MEAAGLSRQALFASQQAPDPLLHGLFTRSTPNGQTNMVKRHMTSTQSLLAIYWAC